MCWYETDNFRVIKYVLAIYILLYFIDIDECETGTDNCDVNATCTNRVGNFTCTCNQGYHGDGVSCDGRLSYIHCY